MCAYVCRCVSSVCLRLCHCVSTRFFKISLILFLASPHLISRLVGLLFGPFAVTRRTLGGRAAPRQCCWLTGLGQECACSAFVAFVPGHPDLGDPGEQGSEGCVLGLHTLYLDPAGLRQHRLQGLGGCGNYAKAMHSSDKVIYQIISHNFNSFPEFPFLPEPAGYCITSC